MLHRFFADRISSHRVTLSDAEANHALRALRLKVGDRITLFDGTGLEYVATLIELNPKSALLEIGDPIEISRELPGEIVIATALPKGDRQKFLLEKLTELGVHRFIPLVTENAVVQPGEQHVDKFRRYVIEASKQCRRNQLMSIEPVSNLSKMVKDYRSFTRIFLHPSGCLRFPSNSVTRGQADLQIIFVIGPEAGFSESEVEFGKFHDCQIVSLGSRVLRIETAAIAVAASMATYLEGSLLPDTLNE